MSNLLRYIKNSSGTKVKNRTRSVNITLAQHEYIESLRLNLSLIVREVLDGMIKQAEQDEIDQFKILPKSK